MNLRLIIEEVLELCGPLCPSSEHWLRSEGNLAEDGRRLGLILSGQLLVQQASVFDGLSLNPFALFDDGFGLAEVGIDGRHVVQALMIAARVLVFDERRNLGLKVAGQEVVFQEDAVLERQFGEAILQCAGLAI